MANIMKVKGLVSLVTGGASGLGKATAERLVQQGGKVIICDLPTSKGAEVAASIGEPCVFSPCDVTSEKDAEATMKLVLKTFGRLDTVVNCAGVGLDSTIYNIKKPKKCHSLEDFIKVIDVNVRGTFNITRNACILMARNEPHGPDKLRGVIVNTSSAAAFEGPMGQCAVAASKGAIASMTLPMARDVANAGIRVFSIAPGLFDTPLLDDVVGEGKKSLGKTIPYPARLGKSEEFAHLVQAIIENPIINGEIIRLDGALRMSK